jgi:hypothetical protein
MSDIFWLPKPKQSKRQHPVAILQSQRLNLKNNISMAKTPTWPFYCNWGKVFFLAWDPHTSSIPSSLRNNPSGTNHSHSHAPSNLKNTNCWDSYSCASSLYLTTPTHYFNQTTLLAWPLLKHQHSSNLQSSKTGTTILTL